MARFALLISLLSFVAILSDTGDQLLPFAVPINCRLSSVLEFSSPLDCLYMAPLTAPLVGLPAMEPLVVNLRVSSPINACSSLKSNFSESFVVISLDNACSFASRVEHVLAASGKGVVFASPGNGGAHWLPEILPVIRVRESDMVYIIRPAISWSKINGIGVGLALSGKL